MREGIKKIIERTQALPASAGTLADLSRLLRSENTGVNDIERVIRPDISLTANLLRLANSAYFGLRRKVTSVRQAIALLGSDRVFELASSAWFCSVLPERIPGYDVSAKSLWIHSVAVGVLCEQLAAAAHCPSPDFAFTAGLMHDVGKLVIGTLLVDKIDGVLVDIHQNNRSFIEAEHRALGMDHAEVGEILCDMWGLPPNLVWAAGCHHAPNTAPPGADQSLIDLIHLADGLAHSLGFGYDVGELARSVDGNALDRLLITSNAVDRAVNDSVLNQIWEMGDLVPGSITC